MAKNIKHQLRDPVFRSFREGIDKHSIKAKGGGEGLVFSYSQRNNLLDIASQLGDFLKEKNIKHYSQITGNLIREYLDTKAETCSQYTLDAYRSGIKKIGLLLNKDWSCEKVLSNRTGRSPDRGAGSVISREDLEIIIKYGDEHAPCASAVVIKLERYIGVRVSDICYGIKVCPDKLEIKCKGGKVLTREITPEIRAIVNSEAFRQYMVGDKWKPVSDGAVNRYLNRVQDKLGLERHSFHDIRRRIAQDYYDGLREKGIPRSKAIDMTAVWLNHNEGRKAMLLRSYIRAW